MHTQQIKTLRLVRYAIALAMVIAATVAAFVASSRGPLDIAPEMLHTLTLVAYAASAAGVMLHFVLRSYRERLPPSQRGSIVIVGSAISEAAALVGVIVILFGGSMVPWIVAMICAGIGWSILPVES